MKTSVKGGIMAFIVIALCIIIAYLIWSNPGTIIN
jgi:hypothetical protein